MKKLILKPLDIDVINFIINNNSATIDELCNCFEVSPVNIRNVLTKIENFLLVNKLGCLSKNNGQYFFENNNIILDFNYKDFATKDLEKKERIVYIVLKLILEGSINLTGISKELNVSRITLSTDMEFIKELIQDFDLKLVSVQWRGVFLKGEKYNLQKFSILFISKLYIEGYFSSNLKKIVNPIIFDYFRNELDEETEMKLIHLADKLYHYFNIKLGPYPYYVLIGSLVFIHIGAKKNIEFCTELKKPFLNLTEPLNDILDLDDRNLLKDNTLIVMVYLSLCISKKFSNVFPVDTIALVNELFSIFNLKEDSSDLELLNFFIYVIYFQNRFFIPSYVKIDKSDEENLRSEQAQKLIFLFEKYKIPYTQKSIIVLYHYLNNLLNNIKKKNILVIDNSILNWKGNKLKEKLNHLENVNLISITSYFNFKFFPIETYKKYEIFIFLDLPNEKKSDYPDKICHFITGYELLKNSINFNTLI